MESWHGDGAADGGGAVSRISLRQMEILNAMHRIGRPTEWGDVWDRVGWGGSPLEMLNFDRATNALRRRGLIAYDADNLVNLTDDGRSLVEIARRERTRIMALPDLTTDEIRKDARAPRNGAKP